MKPVFSTIVLALSILVSFNKNAHAALPEDDPGRWGTYKVAYTKYDLGDEVFQPDGFTSNVDVKGSVHYPTGLVSETTNGNISNRPVIVFVHGKHATCYNSSTNNFKNEWPCSTDFPDEIPSYTGYDYVAAHLASYGFIVISISTNGINALETNSGDFGSLARAQLIQYHLDKWNDWNTQGNGPLNGWFVGKLDLNRVGTIGHSRGGEAVAKHLTYNSGANGSNYGVKAVMLLAPFNTQFQSVTNASLANMISYCDGDLANGLGVRYFDHSLYNVETPNSDHFKYQFVMMGANHNYYNVVWSPNFFPAATGDDWSKRDADQKDPHCGTKVNNNGRLSAFEQRNAAKAYITAFFKASMLSGDDVTNSQPFLTGEKQPPQSSGLTADDIRISFQAPASKRLDINRITTQSNSVNDLGESIVINANFYNTCGYSLQNLRCTFVPNGNIFNFQEPHNAPNNFDNSQMGVTQQRLSWNNNGGSYINTLPNINVQNFNVLQVRVASDILNSQPQDLSEFAVVLVDANGNQAFNFFENPEAFSFPPGSATISNNVIPKTLLSTARISLDSFTGIDLSNLVSLQFHFPQNLGNGSILISDISFANTEKN